MDNNRKGPAEKNGQSSVIYEAAEKNSKNAHTSLRTWPKKLFLNHTLAVCHNTVSAKHIDTFFSTFSVWQKLEPFCWVCNYLCQHERSRCSKKSFEGVPPSVVSIMMSKRTNKVKPNGNHKFYWFPSCFKGVTDNTLAYHMQVYVKKVSMLLHHFFNSW